MTDPLVSAALAVRENAFAPFSKFKVGAAVEDSEGRIHGGCNVENATYGLTVCAERIAVFKAISEGVRNPGGTSRPGGDPRRPRTGAAGRARGRTVRGGGAPGPGVVVPRRLCL